MVLKKMTLRLRLLVLNGEKLYEELTTEEEVGRAIELEKYYSVLPALIGIYKNLDYSYEDVLSKS